MEYTISDRIYDLTFGKIENYIATKRSPKYIEMVRAEIKKINPNNLEETEKLKEFIENKVPYSIKSNEKFMLTLLKENEKLPNIRKAIAEANYATNNKKVMNEIFKHSEIDELYVLGSKLENDKDFVLSMLKNNYKGFNPRHNISEELQNDREIMLEVCRYYIEKSKLSDEYYNDITFQIGDNLQLGNLKAIYKALQNDSEAVLEAIKEDSRLLKIVSNEMKNNKEIVIEAVKQNGMMLKYASPRLQDDREIVMEAINDVPKSMLYASKRLKNDTEIGLKALENTYYDFSYISKDQENTEILIAAIKRFGTVVPEIESSEFGEFIDPRFTQYETFMSNLTENARDNKEIMLAAINENGSAFKYASERMRSDKELLNLALERYSYDLPLEYASPELKNDKEIILKAINKDSKNIKYASPEIRNEPEVVMESIKSNGSNFKYASDELKNNKDFILSALLENTNIYSYIPESQKENTTSSKELVETILKEKHGFNLTQEKTPTVEKKVENSKPKETSKEKPTRSRARSTGNER